MWFVHWLSFDLTMEFSAQNIVNYRKKTNPAFVSRFSANWSEFGPALVRGPAGEREGVLGYSQNMRGWEGACGGDMLPHPVMKGGQCEWGHGEGEGGGREGEGEDETGEGEGERAAGGGEDQCQADQADHGAALNAQAETEGGGSSTWILW